MADIRINYDEIRRFQRGPEVREYMQRAGEAVRDACIAAAAHHVKTGAYVSSFVAPEIDGANKVTVRNTDKKATWLELGTEPHVITGNPWLFWPGAVHPVRSVQHPGTKPYRIMTNALKQVVG